MKAETIGFIGGGRVVKIFMQAYANKMIKFGKVLVYDTSSDAASRLKQSYPEIVLTNSLSDIMEQQVVFIALHPPVIMETLEKISGMASKGSILISLAPKITTEKISAKLHTTNLARLIPNATSFINKGYNPLSFHLKASDPAKAIVKEILAPLGYTFEVEESKLEAYAILSAMLPTYFWFQWAELSKLGEGMGLNQAETLEAIRESLKASIEILFSSGLTPDEVIDLIPVKPIGAFESQIAEIYRTTLPALYEKIKP